MGGEWAFAFTVDENRSTRPSARPIQMSSGAVAASAVVAGKVVRRSVSSSSSS
jgi:hypothetical protein